MMAGTHMESRMGVKARIRSARADILHLLQSALIEYQGEYTMKLQDYATNTFSRWRLAALLFVTPWPSIAIILLMELAPLNPPSAGAHDNMVFWLRITVANFVDSVCYVTISRTIVRFLNLTLVQSLCSILFGTAAATGTAYTFAVMVGFPVPFTMVVSAGPWIVSLWLVMGAFSFRRIFADVEATLSFKEWVNACALGSTQLFVYPLYNYAFRIASPMGQTGLSIILGMLKACYRFSVGKMIKLQTDEQAEVVTFGVEIAHAMFVAFSMQNASSILTVAVLLMIDLLHAITVVYDVSVIVQKLDALDFGIREMRKEVPQYCSVIDRAVELASCELGGQGPPAEIIQRSTSSHIVNTCGKEKQTSMFHYLLHSFDRRHPKHCRKRSRLADQIISCKGSMEAEYIATARRLLYLTEFTMLGELVEVVVPIIYTWYVGVMVHLPNRAYCTQLSATTADNFGSIALRMLSYGFLELASLVLLDLILRNRLRFSPAAQLAMVLETRWTSIHSAFVMWVMYTVQGLFEHYGVDFSFQFAWLHGNTTNS